jgi:hypothetical protein
LWSSAQIIPSLAHFSLDFRGFFSRGLIEARRRQGPEPTQRRVERALLVIQMWDTCFEGDGRLAEVNVRGDCLEAFDIGIPF